MRLEIDDEALAEAAEAREYYSAIQPALGRDFAERLDRSMARILAQPLLWPAFTGRTRRYLMDRFPYAVVYRIKDDAIRVLAVMHQHRRPGYWTPRAKRSA